MTNYPTFPSYPLASDILPCAPFDPYPPHGLAISSPKEVKYTYEGWHSDTPSWALSPVSCSTTPPPHPPVQSLHAAQSWVLATEGLTVATDTATDMVAFTGGAISALLWTPHHPNLPPLLVVGVSPTRLRIPPNPAHSNTNSTSPWHRPSLQIWSQLPGGLHLVGLAPLPHGPVTALAWERPPNPVVATTTTTISTTLPHMVHLPPLVVATAGDDTVALYHVSLPGPYVSTPAASTALAHARLLNPVRTTLFEPPRSHEITVLGRVPRNDPEGLESDRRVSSSGDGVSMSRSPGPLPSTTDTPISVDWVRVLARRRRASGTNNTTSCSYRPSVSVLAVGTADGHVHVLHRTIPSSSSSTASASTTRTPDDGNAATDAGHRARGRDGTAMTGSVWHGEEYTGERDHFDEGWILAAAWPAVKGDYPARSVDVLDLWADVGGDPEEDDDEEEMEMEGVEAKESPDSVSSGEILGRIRVAVGGDTSLVVYDPTHLGRPGPVETLETPSGKLSCAVWIHQPLHAFAMCGGQAPANLRFQFLNPAWAGADAFQTVEGRTAQRGISVGWANVGCVLSMAVAAPSPVLALGTEDGEVVVFDAWTASLGDTNPEEAQREGFSFLHARNLKGLEEAGEAGGASEGVIRLGVTGRQTMQQIPRRVLDLAKRGQQRVHMPDMAIPSPAEPVLALAWREGTLAEERRWLVGGTASGLLRVRRVAIRPLSR